MHSDDADALYPTYALYVMVDYALTSLPSFDWNLTVSEKQLLKASTEVALQIYRTARRQAD